MLVYASTTLRNTHFTFTSPVLFSTPTNIQMFFSSLPPPPIFEQGFFDTTSIMHTVEIEAVDVKPIVTGGGAAELRLKNVIVEMQQEIGYNATFETWWIPSESASRSPLWCAVRATLLTRHDLPAKEEDDVKAGALVKHVLTQPIYREDDAQRHLKRLLQDHLNRYSNASASGGIGSAKVHLSGQLVDFEQSILRGHLKALSTPL